MASDEQSDSGSANGMPDDPSESIAKSVEEGRTLLDDIRRRNRTAGSPDEEVGDEDAIDEKAGPSKFNFIRPVAYLGLMIIGAGALYYFYSQGTLEQFFPGTAEGPDRVAGLSAELQATDTRIDALERRLSSLSEQMGALSRAIEESNQSFNAALATIPAGNGQDPSDDGRVEALASELASELATLRMEIASLNVPRDGDVGESAASIAAIELARRLETRITTLEGQAGSDGTGAGSVAGLRYVAFGSLKAAVSTSLPFANELTAFRHAVSDDDLLGGLAIELQGFARAGIPSFASLKTSYPVQVRNALKAIKGVSEDASVFDKAWSEITSLVTVRRTGELEGEDAQSVFARAEQRLGAGSLDDAVDELMFLDAEAANAVSGWLEMARARLASESVLRMIEARLLDSAMQSPSD